MLRTRIITALILAPSVIAAIYGLPTHWFALVFALLAATAAYEWSALIGLDGPVERGSFIALFFIACAIIWFVGQPMFTYVLVAGMVLWLMACLAIMVYPSFSVLFRPVVAIPIALMMLCSAWAALVSVHGVPAGSHWLLWFFVLIAFADIGAYFSGRAYGRHKLAVTISPGKTWEGFVGGLVFAMSAGLGLLWVFGQVTLTWVWVAPVLIGLAAFGDLFESVLKRRAGVKDSGTLLPGHGGVLDRVDAMLSALPFFAFALGTL